MKYAFAFIVLATGCAASSTSNVEDDANQSESAVSSTRWEATIHCDDGSVLDVNADERRELQFVVRNKDAIFWLQHGIECSTTTCPTNAKGELVFRGRVDRGVFHPWDFDKVLASLTPATPSWSVAGLFDKEGENIKLQIGEYYDWTFRNCR